MTKELKMLMDDLEIYLTEDCDVHFLAANESNGGDRLEIVKFTADSSYILRVLTGEDYADCKVLYFNFETVELLIDFLEEHYVY